MTSLPEGVRVVDRPDGRRFLSFGGALADRPQALSDAARLVDGRLFANVDEAETDVVATLTDIGFEVELTSESFQVPIEPCLDALRWPRQSSRITIVSAEAVDPDELFALDIELRQDVPGTNGWLGNREWFDTELASPSFDPTTYLVSRDRDTSASTGLVRMWQNHDGPTLGLVGVRRSYRKTGAAALLLRSVLTATRATGSTTFQTHASVANHTIHARLQRIGATPTGRFHQMVRQP